MGVDVDDDSIGDKSGEGVVDLMSTKESALRLAVDAAVTVLRVRELCCGFFFVMCLFCSLFPHLLPLFSFMRDGWMG